MKKVPSLLMVLALLVSFAACSAEKDFQNPSDPVESGTAAAENQTVAEELPQLVVEDFEVTHYEKDELKFKIKFRNISDVDLETFSFLYQILDTNGDILYDLNCGGSSVDAGQAIWTGPWINTGSIPVADIAAVAIKSSPHSSKKNAIAEKKTFAIPSGRPIGGDDKTSDNTESVAQFRDYLETSGVITVVTEEINTSNTESKHQVSLEATADGIQVSYESEVTTLSGKASAYGRSLLQFTITPNVEWVNTQLVYFLGGDDGDGHRDIQSVTTTYELDIYNYRSGKKITVNADYTRVDENGNSIKEDGTQMELVLTTPCTDATTVLSQVLQESGLNITMADLGFANYEAK